MRAFFPSTDNGGASRFGHLEGLELTRGPSRGGEILPYVVARSSNGPASGAGDPFHDPHELDSRVGAELKSNVSVLSLFNSRRIGRQPQGAALAWDEAGYADIPGNATILGAAKVRGRIPSGWSLGLLNATTRRESAPIARADGTRGEVEVEPFSNYFVARPRSSCAYASVSTDSRKPVVPGAEGERGCNTEGACDWSVGVDATFGPVSNVTVTVGPSWGQDDNSAEYVTTGDDPTATALSGRWGAHGGPGRLRACRIVQLRRSRLQPPVAPGQSRASPGIPARVDGPFRGDAITRGRGTRGVARRRLEPP